MQNSNVVHGCLIHHGFTPLAEPIRKTVDLQAVRRTINNKSGHDRSSFQVAQVVRTPAARLCEENRHNDSINVTVVACLLDEEGHVQAAQFYCNDPSEGTVILVEKFFSDVDVEAGDDVPQPYSMKKPLPAQMPAFSVA